MQEKFREGPNAPKVATRRGASLNLGVYLASGSATACWWRRAWLHLWRHTPAAGAPFAQALRVTGFGGAAGVL